MSGEPLQHTALILISSGFDEASIVACLKKLRGSGLEAKLVGQTAGLLVGSHGLTVRPDITLGCLEPQEIFRLVVVPGSIQSTRLMLADPRVHQLFSETTRAGGQVAVMGTAEAAFVQAGLLEFLAGSSVLVQGRQNTTAFVNELVHLSVT